MNRLAANTPDSFDPEEDLRENIDQLRTELRERGWYRMADALGSVRKTYENKLKEKHGEG